MRIDLSKDDWGGSVPVAGRKVSIRDLVAAIGTTFWLSVMLIRTGSAGMHSLATTAQFLLTIVLLGAATFSLKIRPLLSVFLAGGFTMGLVAIVGRLFRFDAHTVSMNFIVAVIEEAAIIGPPLYLLWSWRKWRLCSLGATDIFLIFAACGAGFALVETAYILSARTLDQFSLFPVIAWDGDRIRGYHLFNGHEIWAGLAGQTIGLALLLRSKGPIVWLIGLAGIIFGVIDHFVLDTQISDFPVNALRVLTGNGYLTLTLFLAGLFATTLFDAYIIYRTLPQYLWLLKRPLFSKYGFSSLLELRSLAFANYQLEQAAEKDEAKIAAVCLALTDKLLERISTTEKVGSN